MTTRKDSAALPEAWKLDQSQFYNGAVRHTRWQDVELTLDESGLEVRAESGLSYNSSSETVRVPLEVLTALLEHAGYRVEKRSVERTEE